MHILSVTREELLIDLNTTPPAARLPLLDVLEVRKDDPRWLPLLTGQESLITVRGSARALAGGGGFVRVSVASEYLEPYLALLETRTGQRLSMVALPSLLEWTYTHLMETCEFRNRLVHATMVVMVYPPLDSTVLSDSERETKAQARALECLNRALGETETVREFIPYGESGLFRRNPDYGRGPSRTLPRPVNEAVWHSLFDQWVHTLATPAQREILGRLAHPPGSRQAWPGLRDYHLYLDHYRTTITWQELKDGIIPSFPAASA